MSRVAKAPVMVPQGVTVTLNNRQVNVTGSNGELELTLHELVELDQDGSQLKVKPYKDNSEGWMHAATTARLIANMIEGVSQGFQKILKLVGVGYKAQVQGQKVTLNVGYSHPVEYTLPDSVSAETPSATELILKSANKQQLGQAAANIRAYRPPEPYKGKGIRYADEHIVRKEAKKK